MKRLLLAAAAASMLLCAQQANADDFLKERKAMVAAVAVLLALPPKCTVNSKRPSGSEIERFIVAHGHKGDNAFLADVKAAIKSQEDGFEQLPQADQKSAVDFICGWGVMLTAKLREAQ